MIHVVEETVQRRRFERFLLLLGMVSALASWCWVVQLLLPEGQDLLPASVRLPVIMAGDIGAVLTLALVVLGQLAEGPDQLSNRAWWAVALAVIGLSPTIFLIGSIVVVGGGLG